MEGRIGNARTLREVVEYAPHEVYWASLLASLAHVQQTEVDSCLDGQEQRSEL